MEKVVKLKIYGMSCEDCVRAVTNGLKSADGVINIEVKIGAAIVRINDEKISPQDLLKLDIFGSKSHYRAQVIEVE